jgi:hypothetical protein
MDLGLGPSGLLTFWSGLWCEMCQLDSEIVHWAVRLCIKTSLLFEWTWNLISYINSRTRSEGLCG